MGAMKQSLSAALAAGAVLGAMLGGPPATAAPAGPGAWADGTIVRSSNPPAVSMIVDGSRVDFDGEADLNASGCRTSRSVHVPKVILEAVPAGPDPLYAAAERDVDVDRITPDPEYREDCLPLYRADNRAPEVIFAEGFAPKDTVNGQYDITSYVLKNQPSPYVSTTYRDDLYKAWKPKFYYVVDAPGGIDVNGTIGDAHQYADQEEVAFPGGLDEAYIVEACPVVNKELIEDDCVRNPGYEPWRG